jgi:hypothetical protein
METPVVKAVPNERDVRVWLEGQRIAALKIEQERVRTLLELTHKEALQIYQGLLQISPHPRSLEEPSPLLMAMRRLLRAKASGCQNERIP